MGLSFFFLVVAIVAVILFTVAHNIFFDKQTACSESLNGKTMTSWLLRCWCSDWSPLWLGGPLVFLHHQEPVCLKFPTLPSLSLSNGVSSIRLSIYRPSGDMWLNNQRKKVNKNEKKHKNLKNKKKQLTRKIIWQSFEKA